MRFVKTDFKILRVSILIESLELRCSKSLTVKEKSVIDVMPVIAEMLSKRYQNSSANVRESSHPLFAGYETHQMVHSRHPKLSEAQERLRMAFHKKQRISVSCVIILQLLLVRSNTYTCMLHNE